MADEAPDLGSVFEYSSDISKQEAPPPLPGGRNYIGTVTAAVAKQSNNKPDNQYADIEFTINPDQFPPDFRQTDPVKLHYRRVLLRPDNERVRYQIRKLCEKLRTPVNRVFDINDLMGKVASLKVSNKPYMGEMRAEIDDIEMA